jgi:hypothetical protein
MNIHIYANYRIRLMNIHKSHLSDLGCRSRLIRTIVKH